MNDFSPVHLKAPQWAGALVLCAAALLTACSNDPNPEGLAKTNTLFETIEERSPRYLDPTASYSNNESKFTFQVYETLYSYHYFKRPYTLVPKVATQLPKPRFVDKDGKSLPDDAPTEQIAESVYDIAIQPGIKYAPHPAFAVDDKGQSRYLNLKAGELGQRRSPWDFEHQGSRELVADDFVYAIKRHATPRVEAPIFGIFSEYVLGLKEYSKLIREEDKKLRASLKASDLDKPFLDFRKFDLMGATAPDKYTVRFRIKGKYPQWKYWLTMPFTSPVPWEADAFYAQAGMNANGLSLITWPVGTGPYMMTTYERDRLHVMKRNPNFRGEPFPCEGMPEDKAAGLLADCGKMMPFIDTVMSPIEKEALPREAKFLGGYLDTPIMERADTGNEYLVYQKDSEEVAARYKERGYKIPQMVDISSWYMGFNWLDPVVGKGDTAEQQLKNRKLRQAISIAIDWEEGYSKVFPKKSGEAAHGPIPGGLFGSRHGSLEGHNPVTHKIENGKIVRRSIQEAKKLLVDAGYPDGRDVKTGKPLVLNYDYQRVPSAELKAELDWMVKQYAKIDIQLEIRATDYNQFQEKMLKGKQQIFWWGWLADYPDAENFLFLLYGPNSKAKHEGENSANYESDEYDKRYKVLATMEDSPAKQKLIDEMVGIAQQDAIWAWGYFPYASVAYQGWLGNGKPSILIRDYLKYWKLDVPARVKAQAEWNRPQYWPLALLALLLAGLIWVAKRSFTARENAVAKPTGAIEPGGFGAPSSKTGDR